MTHPVARLSESHLNVARLSESLGLITQGEKLLEADDPSYRSEGHDSESRATAGRRRGHTLVELVAVIGASMAIMGITVALIHSTFDAERSLRRQLAARQAVERLAESFREDVRSAGEATLGSDPPRCTLDGEGGTSIVYRLEHAQVVRETLGEDKPTASVAFPLPRRCTVEFHQQEEAGHTLVVLAFVPKPAGDGPPGPSPGRLRVTALLGHADRHLERPAALPVLGEKP